MPTGPNQRRECSCRGENASCWRCDGRGYLGESKPSLAVGETVFRFVCALCSIGFSDESNLERHRKTAHTEPTRYGLEMDSRPIEAGRVCCCKCRRVLWADDLQSHIDLRHVERSFGAKRGFLFDKQFSDFVLCPVCNVTLKRDNLGHHFNKAH